MALRDAGGGDPLLARTAPRPKLIDAFPPKVEELVDVSKAKMRTYRPWVAEPGLWLQFDGGDGPRIGGRKTYLFCAWLAWSRFRVVIPVWDQLPAALVSGASAEHGTSTP